MSCYLYDSIGSRYQARLERVLYSEAPLVSQLKLEPSTLGTLSRYSSNRCHRSTLAGTLDPGSRMLTPEVRSNILERQNLYV